MLAARWASAWVEKSLQRPPLELLASGAFACVVERCAVAVAVVLAPADSFALLVVGSALPQAASRIALAAAKAANEGALILREERFKTAPTLCLPVYCGGGGSLRKA